MVVRTNLTTEIVGDYQCNSEDIPVNLPMDVTDGSTMLVVETFNTLIFHNGCWYDGNGYTYTGSSK